MVDNWSTEIKMIPRQQHYNGVSNKHGGVVELYLLQCTYIGVNVDSVR